ncbi:hypothetical protein B7P43_G00516 [Cryptotermes secundus]|uniref:Uncharacterized protein n=1 Tax=Cryptotermes secundus TaxID=105785 RepID=A0A2J7R686_9NEOP|nr:hypothetical protein B7P43_G00516 [Cryptotermes secundus]
MRRLNYPWPWLDLNCLWRRLSQCCLVLNTPLLQSSILHYSILNIPIFFRSRPGPLHKAHADSIEDTPHQGSISRVRQSVASGTLPIDYTDNVFRLIRCYSKIDLSLWELYSFHVFVAMEVCVPIVEVVAVMDER